MRIRTASILLLALGTTALVHQPRSAAATAAPNESQATHPPAAAADVLAFERNMEAAVVRGDITYLEKIIPADFSFTHGEIGRAHV